MELVELPAVSEFRLLEHLFGFQLVERAGGIGVGHECFWDIQELCEDQQLEELLLDLHRVGWIGAYARLLASVLDRLALRSAN